MSRDWCHSAARAYYPISCFQMAPECRSLKLLLKSSKLNQHILIEVETIQRFLFFPTSLFLNIYYFNPILGPGNVQGPSWLPRGSVRATLIITVPFNVCKASSFRC